MSKRKRYSLEYKRIHCRRHDSAGRVNPKFHPNRYPTTRAVALRTHGAMSVTVGKATGQVVAQLFSHCGRNSSCSPCVVARTNAETMATMIAERGAPKTIGE